MLEHITIKQVRQIADLAKGARTARDHAIVELPERDFGEPTPARGEHNPAAALGFDPLPADHPARAALRDAVAALSDEARSELVALAWVGRGEYGFKDWQQALSAADAMLPAAKSDLVTEQVDLHELLTKSLYELKLR